MQKRIPFAAALMFSAVTLACGPALAQGTPSAVQQSQAPATHGSGASNNPGTQPPGTLMGSGNTPTGISNGENPGNRGAGNRNMVAPDHMTRTTHHRTIHHRRRHRHTPAH